MKLNEWKKGKLDAVHLGLTSRRQVDLGETGVYTVCVSECTRQEAELVVTFPDWNVACVWIDVSEIYESGTCISSRAYNKLTSLQLKIMWLVIEIFQFILFTRGWPVHVRIHASISPQSLSVGLTFKETVYQKVPNKMSDWKMYAE